MYQVLMEVLKVFFLQKLFVLDEDNEYLYLSSSSGYSQFFGCEDVNDQHGAHYCKRQGKGGPIHQTCGASNHEQALLGFHK